MNPKDSIGYMIAKLTDEGYTVYFIPAAPLTRCLVLDDEGGVIAESSEVGVYNALLTCYSQAPIVSRAVAVPEGQLSFAPEVAPVSVGDYSEGE